MSNVKPFSSPNCMFDTARSLGGRGVFEEARQDRRDLEHSLELLRKENRQLHRALKMTKEDLADARADLKRAGECLASDFSRIYRQERQTVWTWRIFAALAFLVGFAVQAMV